MYKPKYFSIKELVTPSHFKTFTEAQLWRCFDDRILRAADLLRLDFGPIIVNNWHSGGDLENCGLRYPDFYDKPSVSQHLWGRALDLHFKDHSSEYVINNLLRDDDMEYSGLITRVELGTPTWVHIDCCNSDLIQMTTFRGN